MDIVPSPGKTQKNREVFCCYARNDQSLLQELKKHLTPLLREGFITLWADTDIDAGAEWEKEIHLHLNTASLILLLVSPDFLASDYCYSIEMKRALERHERGEAHVIPIILRPVDWKRTPLGKLQAIPKDANPITKWNDRDEAFQDVAERLRNAVEAILNEEEKRRQVEEDEQRKADSEKQRLHEEVTPLPKTEEQGSKAQEKGALLADGTLIHRAEAQSVHSAFENPADQQDHQPSLFARRFLRPSNTSTAPLTFSRLSQSQPSLRTLNDPPPQPGHTELHVKTRDEFLKEALGSWAEPYIPWFTAFALLAGLGIGTAILIRSSVPFSWVWSMGTVLVATPLIYLTAYRKVIPLSLMIIIALLSAAGAAGLATYTSTFISASETNNLQLFGISQNVSLDRQLYLGFIVGGGMGLLASVGGALTEGLDDPWELLWGSNMWGALIWLGLVVLSFLVKWVSPTDWEFGFGYGWDMSLMALEAAILTPLGITYWLTFWIKGAKVKIV